MQPTKDRKPWQLKARDFGTSKVHADQETRFQLFFQYLRISPSYALATTCQNERQLAKLLGDSGHAAAVWKTYADVGNVFGTIYREWWLTTGIGLFGVRSARPLVESVMRLPRSPSAGKTATTSASELEKFIQSRFREQGSPDSLLVSIPLNLNRASMLKQLGAMLDAIGPVLTAVQKPLYVLEANKMRQSRLMTGLRLVYMKAARPDGELWRAAARAKISDTHVLNPDSKKKDVKNAEARRMLTIMASRLLHDSLVIAENAAQGVFPSLSSVPVVPFDFPALGQRLVQMHRAERELKAQMMANAKLRNVK